MIHTDGQSFKYLGVIIQENLSWGEHINYICKKAYKRIGILRRIKHSFPLSTRELFVKTMVLPILEYGDIIWGDKHNQSLMQNVQVAQNAAAKEILDKPKYSSASEVLKDLNWKTMSDRRRIHRLIFIYKALNNLLDWNFNFSNFIEIHRYNTRNKYNLRKPLFSTNWGQDRFVCHFINDWNNLPESIRTLPFNLFRKVINN